MDYEKAYKEALERAKKLEETCDSTAVIGWCEYIFPELKESEDEKIRKDVLAFILREGQHIDKYKWHKWIAWLEKQGVRPTPIDIDKMVYKYGNTKEDCTNGLPVNCQIRAYRQGINDTLNLVSNLEKQCEQKPFFNVGDTIIKKHNSDINKFGQFTITDITGGKYWYNDRIICDINEQNDWELVEQKPAWSEEDKEAEDTFCDVEQKVFDELLDNGEQLWSEEDERLCQCLIRDQEKALDEVRNDKYGHSEIISDLKEMYRERIDWLESLKQRLNK